MSAAHSAADILLQLGVVLVAAKLGGEVVERAFRQPAVVGEIIAGALVGPYALGGVNLPAVGRVFEAPAGSALVVPEALWLVAQLGAVVLLFQAGLGTNLTAFLRFGPIAVAVAIGGVAVPFGLGVAGALALGIADEPLAPSALFVGAVMTATSVGVSARVLGDIGKLDTPQGALILGAAVLDDVMGVLILAVVVSSTTAQVDLQQLGWLGVRSILAWVVMTAGLVLIAVLLGRVMATFRSSGGVLGLALGVAFLAAAAAEATGLAAIIGAYSAGLALSRTQLKPFLQAEVGAIESLLVPPFFVSMGMLVDLWGLGDVALGGVALTLLACGGKVVGCAVPARLAGMSGRHALQIGIGMMPRGEVALIIAGAGLAAGAISAETFSLSVVIAVATTLMAPPLLVRTFAVSTPDPSTRSRPSVEARIEQVLDADLGTVLERHLIDTLTASGFETVGDWGDPRGGGWRQHRKGSLLISIRTALRPDGRHSIEVETESAGVDLHSVVDQARQAAVREATRILRNSGSVQ